MIDLDGAVFPNRPDGHAISFGRLAVFAAIVSWPALAGTLLPPDVAKFVERRDACDHFRGEDPYDAQRRRFLEERTKRLCVGTDRELSLLKRKYRHSASVMARLEGYEADIEPR